MRLTYSQLDLHLVIFTLNLTNSQLIRLTLSENNS